MRAQAVPPARGPGCHAAGSGTDLPSLPINRPPAGSGCVNHAITAKEDDAMSHKDDSKHRDKEREKRDADGQRPIDPDTVREPKPGKRGQ